MFQFVLLLKELYHTGQWKRKYRLLYYQRKAVSQITHGVSTSPSLSEKYCIVLYCIVLMRSELLRVDFILRFLRNDPEKIRVAIQGSSDLVNFNALRLQYLEAQPRKIFTKGTKEFCTEEVEFPLLLHCKQKGVPLLQKL